jgi:outer membrane autotransporter protein
MGSRSWVYGAAVAASFASIGSASAACSVSGAVTLRQCDGTFVDVRIGSGSTSLTIDTPTVSNGLFMLPTVGSGTYSTTLTIAGGTTITRDDYPAITLNSDGMSNVARWDVAISIAEGATISSNIQPGAAISGAVFVNVKQPGDIVIDNSGAVSLTFANPPGTAVGYWIGAISGTTDNGDVLVRNNASGSVTSQHVGLYSDSGAGSATIVNDGTVWSRAEGARAIARAGGTASITNTGTITATEQSAIIAWTNLGKATILNTGTVNALNSVGLQGWSTADTARVTNSGTINADDDLNVADKSSNNHAGIDVAAGVDNVATQSGDAYGSNTATGRIFASAGFGIVGSADKGTVYLDNAGLIASKGGMQAVSTRGNASVTNSGTIVAKGATDPVAVALDVTGTATVSNSGTFVGGFTTTGGVNSFTNTGSWLLLSDQTYSGYASPATSGTWSVAGTTTFDNAGLFGVDTVNGQATINGALALTNLAGETIKLARGASLSLASGSLANAGTIDLANGAGNNILTAGSFSSAADAMLKLDVEANGNGDRIVTIGNASVGGKLDVNLVTGDYSAPKTYTIVDVGGTRTGTFTLAKTYAYYDTSLDYQPDMVRLTVQRNGLTLSQAAGGGNGGNAAAAIETLSPSNPLYSAALQLGQGEAASGYGQISGDAQATTLTGIAADSHYVRDATVNRLRQAFGDIGAAGGMALGYGEGGPVDATTTTPFSVWTQGFGSIAHSDDGNTGREFRRTLGTALGADAFVPFGDQVWRLGIAGSYAVSAARVAERGASADIDAYSGMIYAGTEFGHWAVRLGGAGTWNRIDSLRHVSFGGVEDTLTADYWSRTWQAFGELGYRTKVAGIAAEPFAGLSYVVLDTDGATENGNSAALVLDGSTQQTVYSTAGLRLERDFGMVTLRGSAAWRHGYGDLSSNVTARFLAGGDSFTIQGVDTGADTALLSAGMTFKLSPNSTAGLTYDGAFGSDGTEHGGRAEVRVRF